MFDPYDDDARKGATCARPCELPTGYLVPQKTRASQDNSLGLNTERLLPLNHRAVRVSEKRPALSRLTCAWTRDSEWCAAWCG